MKKLTALLLLCFAARTYAQEPLPMMRFTNACDGSAAEAISPTRFALANDEDNILRLYSIDKPGAPVDELDLAPFLQLGAKGEADIEAAARLRDRVYWITSHGRSKKGKLQLDRSRFFCTVIAKSGRESYLAPAGTPSRDLVRRLVDDPRYAALGLAETTGFNRPEAAELAPKEKGFNIEAMTADATNSALLIGLRNPRPQGRALIVTLKNPQQVVDRAADPQFGDPILLDLGGRGLRSIAWSAQHGAYFLLAGAHDGSGDFALLRWSGKPSEKPVAAGNLAMVAKDFAPEGLTFFEGRKEALLLSDDGTMRVAVASADEALEDFKDGTAPNKALKDKARRSFRAAWLDPAASAPGS